MLERLYTALGPILGGMIIDALDLSLFGPVGLYAGLVIGGLAGYWIMSFYTDDARNRYAGAALSGIYCTLPGTEFIPAATMIGVVAKLTRAAETPNDGGGR